MPKSGTVAMSGTGWGVESCKDDEDGCSRPELTDLVYVWHQLRNLVKLKHGCLFL